MTNPSLPSAPRRTLAAAVALALAALALCYTAAGAAPRPPDAALRAGLPPDAPPAALQITSTETLSPTETPAPTAAPVPAEIPTAAPPAAPQQALALAVRKTLLGSDVVQVGQILTFTVRVTNTGTVVVTTLPLVDAFEPTILQPLAGRIQPAPATIDPAAGVMRWPDLTASFGRDLAPGESFTVVAAFRAIRIDDEVINRARVEAAQGAGGETGGDGGDEDRGTVEGGRVTVTKQFVDQTIRLDAPVVTFTLAVRNEGFADLVRAPVSDVFRSDLIQFLSASPPPSFSDPSSGSLRWDDAIAASGLTRLRPNEVLTITTVFRLLGPVDDVVVNRGAVAGAQDEFGNAVQSPREAEVRIRVRGVPAATATTTPVAYPGPETPAPTDEPRRERRETPAATQAPTTPAALTATPEAAGATPAAATPEAATPATAGVAPARLPRTDGGGGAQWPAAVALALLALGGWLALRRGEGRR